MYKSDKQRGCGLVNVVTLDRSVTSDITVKVHVCGCRPAKTVASGLMESRVQDRTGEPNSCYPRFSLKNPSVTDQAMALTHNGPLFTR